MSVLEKLLSFVKSFSSKPASKTDDSKPKENSKQTQAQSFEPENVNAGLDFSSDTQEIQAESEHEPENNIQQKHTEAKSSDIELDNVASPSDFSIIARKFLREKFPMLNPDIPVGYKAIPQKDFDPAIALKRSGQYEEAINHYVDISNEHGILALSVAKAMYKVLVSDLQAKDAHFFVRCVFELIDEAEYKEIYETIQRESMDESLRSLDPGVSLFAHGLVLGMFLETNNRNGLVNYIAGVRGA